MAFSSLSETADGVRVDYNVTFDYLDASHIVVLVDKVRTDSIGSSYKFVWINPTTIRVDTVIDGNPVPTGLEVTIVRQTPIQNPAVIFGAGASLSSENLNKNSQYLTYALQEATDENDAFTTLYLGAKGGNPSTDNKGDTLQIGAIYFNTQDDTPYYWTGSNWNRGDIANLTETYKNAALAAQSAAQAAQAIAESARNTAQASENAAAASKIAASASALAAAQSESAANAYSLLADADRLASAASASQASSSASAASASESTALAARNASQAARDASQAARDAAAASAVAAEDSRVAAGVSETNAAASAAAALQSEINAAVWDPTNYVFVDPVTDDVVLPDELTVRRINIMDNATDKIIDMGLSNDARYIKVSNRAEFGYDGSNAYFGGGPSRGVDIISDRTQTVVKVKPNMETEVFGPLLAAPAFTSHWRPPVGTDAQRPVTPSAGDMRYNSDIGAPEYYDGAAWVNSGGSKWNLAGASIADWNDALANGVYNSSSALNAPAAGWFLGTVISHNDSWVTQEVWGFTVASPTVAHRYRRFKSNGVWGAWFFVVDQFDQVRANANAAHNQLLWESLYVFNVLNNVSGATMNINLVYAGSSLRSTSGLLGNSGAVPGGSWRSLGLVGNGASGIFIRIS